MSVTGEWDTQVAELLTELSQVQGEVLQVLEQKRQRIAANDFDGMLALSGTEHQLLERLEACQTKRAELLSNAAAAGKPADSMRSLAASLPANQRGNLDKHFRTANAQAGLLRHESLTNWVVIQRTLLHLSQMLEIFATGGRPVPTYGNDNCGGGGTLVDQAA